MSFKTKSVEEVGAWMKAEGFSDEVVQIFKGTIFSLDTLLAMSQSYFGM